MPGSGKIEFSNNYFTIMMLLNYLKTARRNLLKHKTFSAINIFGLSFSMSVCLLIITVINDQLCHDNFHENGDRIYRIVTEEKSTSKRPNFLYATTVMPIAGTLKNEYTGTEECVRITKSLRGDAKVGEKIMGVKGIFADQSFLDVFSFKLKHGNPTTALAEPYSVVLSEKTAYKFFAEINPVGKTIEIGNKGEYTITGIVKNPPAKSHIKFDLIGSASTIAVLEKGKKHNRVVDNWEQCSSAYVYILIEEGIEEEIIQNNLDEIAAHHAGDLEDRSFKFQLQQLSAITPAPLMSNAFSQTLPIEVLLFLAFLALIVILSACFNYTNLSISRALSRGKEVGIRKVSGASRSQIIMQFLSESVLFSLVSLVFSLIIFRFLLKAFNQMHIAKEISLNFETNTTTFFLFIGFSIAVGIIAGLSPAIFMASFKPIKVLKNISGVKYFSKLTLRKSLIVLQFTLSLFFIITTLVISRQTGLLINSEYGFNKENIINIRLQDAGAEEYINEIKKRTDVIQASACSHMPVSGQSYAERLRRKVDDEETGVHYFSVDQQYINNLGLSLIAGQNFPERASRDQEQYIIINEAAVTALNFEHAGEAVGETLLMGKGDTTQVQILGVVKNYNYTMLLSKIKPMALIYRPRQFNYVQVRVESDDMETCLAGLEKEWKKHDQHHAFDYQFFDEQVESTYGFVKDLRGIIAVTAILAIIIASLGLFGMAIFNAESKVKEVGIRKVMGAEISDIIIHLSKGFLLLIGLSILIATPIAYFANNLWLQEIATRITIGPQILISGMVILIGIGVMTIGSQSVKAAFTNPVDSLKDE